MSDETGSDSSLPLSLSAMDTNNATNSNTTSAAAVAAVAAAVAADIDADDAAAAAAATAAALHALDDHDEPPRLMQQRGYQQQQQQDDDEDELLELTDSNQMALSLDDQDEPAGMATGESTKQKQVQSSSVPSLMDLIVTPSGARKRMGVGGIRPLLLQPETVDAASAYRPVAKKVCGINNRVMMRTAEHDDGEVGATNASVSDREAPASGQIPSLLELDCSNRGTGGIPSLLDGWYDSEDDWSYYHNQSDGYGNYYQFEADYYGGYGANYQQPQRFDFRQQQQQQPQSLLWGIASSDYASWPAGGLLGYPVGGGGSVGRGGRRGWRNPKPAAEAEGGNSGSKVPSLMPTGPPSLLDFM
ncbi:hypothetical protein BOX15_Mlig019650g1 [Macrostomum lignano]|uniref:Uncharacterized protein n=1 Tax=Macrostomum lignano TaxID=282301 RepID=A0A267H258_9PLAT|nr:hypothetical protein BOX15_Mlig019650g1 [Macrostomum lignano]